MTEPEFVQARAAMLAKANRARNQDLEGMIADPHGIGVPPMVSKPAPLATRQKKPPEFTKVLSPPRWEKDR